MILKFGGASIPLTQVPEEHKFVINSFNMTPCLWFSYHVCRHFFTLEPELLVPVSHLVFLHDRINQKYDLEPFLCDVNRKTRLYRILLRASHTNAVPSTANGPEQKPKCAPMNKHAPWLLTWNIAIWHFSFFSASFLKFSSNLSVESLLVACSFFSSASSDCEYITH